MPLPLKGLQHVSLCVEDVCASARFYSDVLGFTEIKRPSSFDFDGCWLFGYGLGIHLIQGEPVQRPSKINPRGDHLSFQADDLDAVQEQLDDLGITWVRETVVEGGVLVTQIFLHDPDHNMVEICNCGLIPVVPVQEGRAARFSKRASIDMGQHARSGGSAAAAAAAAAASAPPQPPAPAMVTVCGPAGCFPARPPPLSIPEECISRCGAKGAAAAAAPSTTAVAADCTFSGAAPAAPAPAAPASSLLPSFTPHGFLVHRSDDGAAAAGSSPHLPRVGSRPSLAGGNDFAGCFGSAPRHPPSDASFLSPRGDKTWLQQQQQEQRNGGEDEMMDATTQAGAAVLSSPPPSLVSVAAGGGGGERGRGGGRG